MALQQVKLRANEPGSQRGMQRCMHRRAKSSRCHGRGEYNYCDSLRASVIGGMVHSM